MRKGFVGAVLLGGSLAGLAASEPALAAQASVGVGDPLTLAAYGVLMPYITGAGTSALIEVASPVQDNPNLQMVFFTATCARGGSLILPETENDIGFVDVGSRVPSGQNGLVAISGAGPLTSPIHSRVYLFNASTGRSRVLEPIILDTAEFPSSSNAWSPLRSGATFYAPLQTATVHTDLTLICPISTIQDTTATVPQQAFPISAGFPAIFPAFPATSTTGNLQVVIYDTAEKPLADSLVTCGCLTELTVTDIDAIYGDPSVANGGTYTELLADLTKQNAFTGYRSVSTVGSPLNNFFGRLSGGSRTSLQGTVYIGVR